MSLVYNKTPLLRRVFPTGLKVPSAPQLYVKYESLQPSGSFKSRGIGHLIMKNALRVQQLGGKSLHVFSSSGGNAGLAAATASQSLKLPCTVVVPTSTKSRMVEKIRNVGTEVIVKGSHWKEADSFLKNSVIPSVDRIEEPIYVHPFDHPDVWEGHSTMVDEIVDTFRSQNVSLNKVKAIVCSVGGGGLYNGIIHGLEKYHLADKIPVIAMETDGCNSFNACLKAKKQVELPKITSVATSLGATGVATKAFENGQRYQSPSVVLQDIDVVNTCLKYANDFNIITEPACGASLHMAYNTKLIEKALGKKLDSDDIIVIIAVSYTHLDVYKRQNVDSMM